MELQVEELQGRSTSLQKWTTLYHTEDLFDNDFVCNMEEVFTNLLKWTTTVNNMTKVSFDSRFAFVLVFPSSACNMRKICMKRKKGEEVKEKWYNACRRKIQGMIHNKNKKLFSLFRFYFLSLSLFLKHRVSPFWCPNGLGV